MRRFLGIMGAATFVVLFNGCGAAPDADLDSAHGAAALGFTSPGEVPLGDLPIALRRRAAQHLEDAREAGSPAAWAKARLGPVARALHRPDITGVAYYEITVEGPEKEPLGFIVVSTGRHDHPIAHWSSEGLPPTVKLDATAAEPPSRYFKIDALTYAAESAGGDRVAQLGDAPPKPLDLADAARNPDSLEVTWTPTEDGNGEIAMSGTAQPIQLVTWDGWSELKAGFAGAYQPLIDSLRAQADSDWKVEEALQKDGEGIEAGRTMVVALLSPGAEVQITGPGADLVRAEIVSTAGDTEILRIAPVAAKSDEQSFTIDVRYPDGTGESLRYAVVPEIPRPVGNGPWSPWREFWAGNSDGSDQPRYFQLEPHSIPNVTSCKTGCGATAWAMLFAWADNQASLGNTIWTPHWGLYRLDGAGCAAPDEVAPMRMRPGVRAVTWELRNQLGTFCLGSQGATWPSNMWRASAYLSCRANVGLLSHGTNTGITSDKYRDLATGFIKYFQRPAIIGTGFLSHYPLAFGYRERSRLVRYLFWSWTDYERQYFVNEGQGGDGNGWVPASTWYVGTIFPN